MSNAFRLLWLSISRCTANTGGRRGHGRSCSGRRFWIRVRNLCWPVWLIWSTTWEERV